MYTRFIKLDEVNAAKVGQTFIIFQFVTRTCDCIFFIGFLSYRDLNDKTIKLNRHGLKIGSEIIVEIVDDQWLNDTAVIRDLSKVRG